MVSRSRERSRSISTTDARPIAGPVAPCDAGRVTDYLTPGLIRWRKITDAPLLILAVGSLPILLLEVARHRLNLADRRFIDAVNVVVLVAFAIDYFNELRLVRMRRTYVRREWTSLLIV